MMKSHIIVILLLSIHYNDCSEEILDFRRFKRQGSFVGDILSIKKTKSIVACALQCSNNAACTIFLYSEDDSMCKMSTNSLRTSTDTSPENIFVMGGKPIILDNRCFTYSYSNKSFQPPHESCEEIYNDLTVTRSDGIYIIDLEGSCLEVYCKQTTNSGGWIVVQRRVDGTVKFDRSWEEYKQGFGDIEGSYWIGNDILHNLTRSRPRKIRFDMKYNGKWYYAEYEDFVVKSEADNYRVSFEEYDGNAGDEFAGHNGQMFSTMDSDNDIHPRKSCSNYYGNGGWWFYHCTQVNPNGVYGSTIFGERMFWYSLTGYSNSLDYIDIKIK